jgi:hypothetical protein
MRARWNFRQATGGSSLPKSNLCGFVTRIPIGTLNPRGFEPDPHLLAEGFISGE